MDLPEKSTKARSGEYVVVTYGSPLKLTKNSYQPAKDLFRTLIRKAPDEINLNPGSVNLYPPKKGHPYPWVSCNIRQENAARKLFKWLAGNSWHGSCLTAWLYNGEGQLLDSSSISAFASPVQLENISPINDVFLLGPVSMTPPTSPTSPTSTSSPSMPHSQDYGRTIPNIINPGTSIHPTLTTSPYTAPNISVMPIHSGNMTNQNVTYQLGHAPPPLRNTRHDVFMINEQLQQFAYQAFQCHRPSLNGPMSPSYMPMSPVVWTAPLMATATPHSGYLPARATGYHMALGTPTTSSDPTTPFAYHANPNGSLVNTTQGTVHIDESRAVLIRNLNYRASLEDVRHFFSSAGRIEHCDIGASQKERKKCTARLRFVTAQEAKAAVAIFGSAKFMGRVITAEIAKDDSTIESGALGSNLASTELASIPPKARSGSGPLIIDGSNEIPTDEIKKTVEKIETMKLRK